MSKSANKDTPMMVQYKAMKAQYPDAFLFFRLGDFYEMFLEDAVEASRLLNLTLTRRHEMPMCGVPHHAAEGYIGRLTKLGKKVAICEQLSDPALPGIVKRDVIRVVTPGTTFDERILKSKSNRFIVSVIFLERKIGLAVCDLTTGMLEATAVADLA
jgi:DNA mismatch repair protein MutS